MSAKSHRIDTLAATIRRIKRKEDLEKRFFAKIFYQQWRWFVMLQHEFVRDDVKIRAESMAFLTVVSLLPLIAGGFFVFTIFAQFGMVQDALQGFLFKFLVTIPDEHRVFVEEYIIKFKDSYLKSITDKSGTLGIFALFILIWVGLQVFNNIDRTLNSIWSAEKERPFLEKFRNFMMVTVLAPLVLTSALSVPLIVNKISAQAQILGHLSVLNILLNNLLVPLVILGTFAFLYKFVPVCQVKWKSAMAGAIFATVFLIIANLAMQVYFKFGTNSAYGKLAIIPLIAFWIYVVWMIIISGAEISFLVQHSKDILFEAQNDGSVRNAKGILSILSCLYVAYREGKGAVTLEMLQKESCLPVSRLHGVLEFLMMRAYVVECERENDSIQGAYVLARDISDESLSVILNDYFETQDLPQGQSTLDKKWNQNLLSWCGSFKGDTFSKIVKLKQ